MTKPKPKFVPTEQDRKAVKAMAAYGIPQTQICLLAGLGAKALRMHFRQELDLGAIQANSKVAERLYKTATEDPGQPGVTAAIFWAKTRMGWRETQRVENTGADGAPMATPTPAVIIMPDNGREDERING